MQSSYAAREVLERDVAETCPLHHCGESFLIRELGDAIRKIGICRLRTAHETADPWQDSVEIKIVELPKNGQPRMRALENDELATGFEHAAKLAESILVIRQVPQSEGDRHGVKRITGKRQLHRIGFNVWNVEPVESRFLVSYGEHRTAKVGADNPCL